MRYMRNNILANEWYYKRKEIDKNNNKYQLAHYSYIAARICERCNNEFTIEDNYKNIAAAKYCLTCRTIVKKEKTAARVRAYRKRQAAIKIK